MTAATVLRKLETAARSYGPGNGEIKRNLLLLLKRRRLNRAREVLRLHETLCFLRAYPDDRELLDTVERMLTSFERRGDLRRHRDALEDTGVAGTAIRYRFFWPMAHWIAGRWPGQLSLEWDEPETVERLGRAIPQLVTTAEAETLARLRLPARRGLARLLAEGETDASYLVNGIHCMPGDDLTREAFHDAIDATYRVEPGPGTPSRTHAVCAGAPVVFREQAPSRTRPDLRATMRRPPRRVRSVSPREGRKLIDLACEAMVTRSRDLEAFGYGDPRDVRVVDDGDGLQFVVIGVVPERRRLLHALYGYLTLRNGVPIGYVQVDPLLRSAGIHFNTFESFRGGEAAHVFGRVLAVTRRLFGAESLSIEPYQLGQGNAEGLDSGAWWFYYKLGFRPRDAKVRRVLRGELACMKRDRGHRSSRSTLEKLASAHLYFEFRRSRDAVPHPPWEIGARISSVLAAHSDVGRRSASATCSREAARLLGLRSMRGWTAAERQAWSRWSPLVLALPGVSRWSPANRRALVRVARAKGGRRDGDFVKLFDVHPRLGQSVLRTL